jgi:hypothetical protein
MRWLLFGGATLMTVAVSDSARSADLKAPEAAAAYDWSGFYLGADVGLALGHSNWRARRYVRSSSPASVGGVTRGGPPTPEFR